MEPKEYKNGYFITEVKGFFQIEKRWGTKVSASSPLALSDGTFEHYENAESHIDQLVALDEKGLLSLTKLGKTRKPPPFPTPS